MDGYVGKFPREAGPNGLRPHALWRKSARVLSDAQLTLLGGELASARLVVGFIVALGRQVLETTCVQEWR